MKVLVETYDWAEDGFDVLVCSNSGDKIDEYVKRMFPAAKKGEEHYTIVIGSENISLSVLDVEEL